MKVLNLKVFSLMVLSSLLILVSACDKKSDSNPAPAAPAAQVHTYGYVNGVCYDTTSNTPAAANLCVGNSGSGNYRWNGTQCVDINGQLAAQQLCQNGGIGQNQFQLINGVCYSNSGYYQQYVDYSFCTGVAGYNANQCNGYYMSYRSGIFTSVCG